jgi:hypothetical protein
VPLANSDEVVVLDTKKLEVERTLSVERPQGLGTSPVFTAVTPDDRELLVAEAGADEIAVFALPGGSPRAWSLIGRIPTAQYPTMVGATAAGLNPCGTRSGKARSRRARRCAKLVYVTGKGLGTGPNPNGPQPSRPDDTDDAIGGTQYLPLLNLGAAGVADFPSDKRIAQLTKVADGDVRPSNPEAPPPGTPLRAGGPIKHVFFIVRENRTYDQILGDDPRGDGDPKLALFGGEDTPDVHALVRRFPLLDHVYADSEASIDGHFWTSAAKVSDYVNQAWFQNYAGRDRPYDFGVYAVTWPGNGFLFDQAERQGISYFNYGEAVAGDVGIFPDKDRTAGDLVEVQRKFARSDLGPNGCYPNDSSIGTDSITGVDVYDTALPAGAKPGSESRSTCFATRLAAQLATDSVPAFNYLVLTNDHTDTLSAGARTPQAMIADNDEALGRVVDTISHSSIWDESAIFVVEDDSQDGADHVDAHRTVGLVISPFTRQGAVVHTRYDMLSMIRSMELILGMKPLGLGDALATPMYDVFTSAPGNGAPFDYVPAKIDLLARNPAGTAGAQAAAQLPHGLDAMPQVEMDRLLWQAVHGPSSVPPPPGPNAQPGA